MVIGKIDGFDQFKVQFTQRLIKLLRPSDACKSNDSAFGKVRPDRDYLAAENRKGNLFGKAMPVFTDYQDGIGSFHSGRQAFPQGTGRNAQTVAVTETAVKNKK